MTIEGNMNPKMSEVDIVPDDDLNTRLKFYVSVQLAFGFRLYSDARLSRFEIRRSFEIRCYLDV